MDSVHAPLTPSVPAPHGRRTAVIIGAGPAGLTAALELLRRTDILPIVLEASDQVGGLSRTVEYKGNRIDIGGHRFFSKSERVLDWWSRILPTETPVAHGAPLEQRNKTAETRDGPLPTTTPSDAVMLVRQRRSRIYFLRRFFAYPLALTVDTLRNLGARRTVAIAASYLYARIRPVRPERSLQDFLINRFGRQLYRTFFQSYTEKLWGVPCDAISAEWGAQRIRGLSLMAAVRDCARRARRRSGVTAPQNETETSLIERFLYPRLGPGQMWQAVADEVTRRGGKLRHGVTVDRLCVVGDRIAGVELRLVCGARQHVPADLVLSTMPVRSLVASLSEAPPPAVQQVAQGLLYRNFITVGVLARTLALQELDGSPLRDNWIYIQEPGVRMTRLQLFHNWSPGMVAAPGTVWVGVEYVCGEQDDLWSTPDEQLRQFAVRELQAIGLLRESDVLDSCVVRAPQAYPAYFGTYDRFGEVREHLAQYRNLFLLGRNGMHRYNNQDHSMLTAMTAVDQIAAGTFDPAALWSVNTEQKHHETP